MLFRSWDFKESLLRPTYKSQRYRVGPGLGGHAGQEKSGSGEAAHCNDQNELHNVQWELETVVEEAHFRFFCFPVFFDRGRRQRSKVQA